MDMDTASIARLLLPFSPGLDEKQLHDISTYVDILQRWNQKINLTAVRDPETIITRHFGESLFAARQLLGEGPETVSLVDVGSGAGFPGLPMKIYAPAIRLTLVEARQKRVAFLREVVRALALQDVNVFAAPAQDLDTPADVVCLRAVEKFARVLPVAAGLVAPSGRLALLIGSSQTEQVHAVLPRFSWSAPIPIPASHSRVLLVGIRNHP